jgi:subtilisin family serine protease
MTQRLAPLLLAAILAALALTPLPSASTGSSVTTRYTVVLAGTATETGFDLAGTKEAVTALVALAGGTVTMDLSRQIGVLGVDSANSQFADVVRASPLVADAAQEHVWKSIPSYDEAVARGQLTVVGPEGVCPDPDDPSCPPGGPDPQADPLEGLQWNMELIRSPQANATVQAGSRAVQVGILDTGIDGAHADFIDADGTNVDCALGRDFIPAGPGAGSPVPCMDNNFHGTHVAGIVAARVQGHGVRGVAPNVTLIPVKVCDTEGYCYSNSTAAGITYAGDAKFEVINMSFFVDDDQFQASTEFKCMSDPVQRTFRQANERAMRYARNQGVVPVAALGNSNSNLADPPEPYENECEVVPAETDGVIGAMSVGPTSEKAYFSSYGVGATDVASPGGNSRNPRGEIPGPCGTQILSTIPGNVWGCFQGTSMASPHAAGVAALIVSQFGRIGTDAGEPDVVMRPQEVESYLQSTTIDLYTGPPYSEREALKGYDGCFGNGRIDAVKAVTHDTSVLRHLVEAPITADCPTFR